LAEILEEMASIYHEWGMARANAMSRLRAASCFGEWMRENAISPRDATPNDGIRFVGQLVPAYQRKVKFRGHCYIREQRAGVNMAVKLLNKRHPPKPPQPSFIDKEIGVYEKFLREKRGLADSGIANHTFRIRPFLKAMFGEAPIHPPRLIPADIQHYVLNQHKRYYPETVRDISGTLRSLFRYWDLAGHDVRLFTAAIPKIRVPRRCLLHVIIDEADYDTLWNAFDRTTATGRRDYAAIRCMADLGMRVGDATILTLDDIKWRQGEIRLPNSKGGEPMWLPLPKALGEALADYVRYGRPKNPSRIIFLRHIGTRGAPKGIRMIGNAFQRALKRAGLHEKYSGTHTLRHSLATRLRRGKASVKDTADVLGHRVLQSTAIYAQIDLPALKAVAQPWPGGGQ
jgi:integrase